MLIRFTGRDDADVFFFVIRILHAIHMDNQQHGTQNTSYGMPPLFALNDAVFSEKCKRIVENKGGRFEREAVVLPLVDPVLFIVVLKAGPTQTASLYKMYNTPRAADRRAPR